MNLNKTCKIQNSRARQDENSILMRYSKSIDNMNDIINYMVNVLKGYTRNGIRRHCWLASQGPEYVMKVQNRANIRQKYGNFERVRQLCQEDSACKKLIQDFDRISSFYLARREEDSELLNTTSASDTMGLR